MAVRVLSTNELDLADLLIARFGSFEQFLGKWLFGELTKARQELSYHILVDYLASPYGETISEKSDHIFQSFLDRAPNECPTLKKKLIEVRTQSEFESVLFEFETSYCLLQHGHNIIVEPLSPMRGPDFKIHLDNQAIYVEVKKLQFDSEETQLWNTSQGTWTRTVTQSQLDKRGWNLYERYFADNQFPNEGLHVLVMDISKLKHSDAILKYAWDSYCEGSTKARIDHPIHVLILCSRKVEGHTSWLNDLTDGAIALKDPSAPVSQTIFEVVKSIFSKTPQPD
jgi:hypothetical protein